MKNQKNTFFFIRKLLPLIIIVVGGLLFICSGNLKWNFIKQYINMVILYEFRLQIVWFIIGVIGTSHYYYVGRKKKESKYMIIQTSMPFMDSVLSVLTYGTIINSCFFLSNEVVNGELIGVDLDWLSIFVAVFIILFWSIKRLFDMGKQTWKAYMDMSISQTTNIESTLINKIDYKPSELSLVVAFSNGSQYEYKQVSNYIFEELNKAESKGKYFHDKIKDKFEYMKLT